MLSCTTVTTITKTTTAKQITSSVLATIFLGFINPAKPIPFTFIFSFNFFIRFEARLKVFEYRIFKIKRLFFVVKLRIYHSLNFVCHWPNDKPNQDKYSTKVVLEAILISHELGDYIKSRWVGLTRNFLLPRVIELNCSSRLKLDIFKAR